jgi:hypothetical protein
MAFHKGRGIMFGGVHDVEMSEEDIDSEFFNALYAWNIERNRFFPLTLRKPRAQKKATVSEQRVGRRGRAQANEEELLRQLAALETGKSLEDLDSMELDLKPEAKVDDDAPVKEMPVLMEPPHSRFNAQLAVQEDVLYIYGGTFEKGDREFTFDDLYTIDLVKLSGCKQIFAIEHEDWIVSNPKEKCEQHEHLANLILHRNPRTRKRTKMKMTMRRTRKMKRETWRWVMSWPRLSLRLANARRSSKSRRVAQLQTPNLLLARNL